MPATVINWGPWSDVGIAQLTDACSPLDPIIPAEGIEAMEALLATDRCRTGVTRLRPDRAMMAFPELQQLGYFTRRSKNSTPGAAATGPGPTRYESSTRPRPEKWSESGCADVSQG